jgi:hypothetical protein
MDVRGQASPERVIGEGAAKYLIPPTLFWLNLPDSSCFSSSDRAI